MRRPSRSPKAFAATRRSSRQCKARSPTASASTASPNILTATTCLTETSASTVSTSTAATAAVTLLTTFKQTVAAVLRSNASDARSLQLRSNSVNSVVDVTTTGLGAIVVDFVRAAAQV